MNRDRNRIRGVAARAVLHGVGFKNRHELNPRISEAERIALLMLESRKHRASIRKPKPPTLAKLKFMGELTGDK
jgi:hypothetical protein